MSPEEGAVQFSPRGDPRPDLAPHPELPDDTRLWAALVQASGGVWGGCVYDVDAITAQLDKGSEDASESSSHATTSTH